MKVLFITLLFSIFVFVIATFLSILSISLMGSMLAYYVMDNPPPPFDIGENGIYFSHFSLQIFYYIPLLIMPIVITLLFSRIFKNFRKRLYIPILLVYLSYLIMILNVYFGFFRLTV
jgi:hypothetical protein